MGFTYPTHTFTMELAQNCGSSTVPPTTKVFKANIALATICPPKSNSEINYCQHSSLSKPQKHTDDHKFKEICSWKTSKLPPSKQSNRLPW